MNKFLVDLYQKLKFQWSRKTPGTSSIELIFFVLTCSILFFFSLETYKFVQQFHKKYSIILKNKSLKLNQDLESLEKQLTNEDSA